MSRSVESLQREMAQHRKNLDKLEEQKATYGLNVPLDILNAIDQEKAEIARIEALLAGRKVPASAPSSAATPLSSTVIHGDLVYGDKVGGDAVGGDKIDTGGGAYIRGDVKAEGGDFVSHDVVQGDQITVGDISGSTVPIGRGAQAIVTQGLSGDEIAGLFAAIYRQIEARPEDPDVDKEELTETVRKIQQEATKGEQANPKRVERWLKTLALMASDIFEVTVATLASPIAGFATVMRKVAAKVKEDAGKA